MTGPRQRAIKATLDLIHRQGVAGVTYRTVAAQAGVPLGSMTYHFASRHDLVFAAFEEFANESFEHLEQAATGDAEDVVQQLTSLVLAEADGRPRDRILLAELYVLSYRDERYAELTRHWMRRARSAIAGTLGDEKARAVDAVQEGLTLQRHFMPDEVHPDLIRDTLRRVALDPLGPDAAYKADQDSPDTL
ncbi:TetR family transcriptional regulator [Streptomyces sp. NPDC019224]|uniref:TetR/AcrR family transcriptional regulator n=1 Tax=unclassified Streptomyces TaxID=2593676 RepID=UPI0033CB9250